MATIDSMITRINKNINAVVNTFGTQSVEYHQQMAAIYKYLSPVGLENLIGRKEIKNDKGKIIGYKGLGKKGQTIITRNTRAMHFLQNADTEYVKQQLQNVIDTQKSYGTIAEQKLAYGENLSAIQILDAAKNNLEMAILPDDDYYMMFNELENPEHDEILPLWHNAGTKEGYRTACIATRNAYIKQQNEFREKIAPENGGITLEKLLGI